MASLTDAGKKRSPLANMALATNAWKKQHERPISQRLVSTYSIEAEDGIEDPWL